MKAHICWIAILFSVFAVAPGMAGEDRRKAAEVAAQVDHHFQDAWRAAGVVAAADADDYVFLRRLTLDIAGRVPTVQEIRAFQADKVADRRQTAIDRLLGGSGYARHWAVIWRRHFLPQADTPKFASFGPGFEAWLLNELTVNTPLDELCRAMLTTPPPDFGGQQAPPRSFLSVAQNPESLAGNSSRIFLGVNLECAQCHDHPHARWSQNQFWEFAAFFTDPQPTTNELPARLELQIPETKTFVQARLFNGDQLKWPQQMEPGTGRQLLAAWMTDPANPYFARNTVNRVWAQLFGRGLIEPLDDLSDHNPASYPQVMQTLSSAFVASGYDLKYLVRIIVSTKAYQLGNATNKNAGEDASFAGALVRGLSGEQVYDSLQIAASLPIVVDEDHSDEATQTPTRPQQRPRAQFLQQFHDVRPSASQRSILQALELMNGRITGDVVSGKTVVCAAETPFFRPVDRVELVFLAVLSRPPADEERKLWTPLVDTADVEQRRRALSDLFWVLINSAEFGVNR